MGALGTCNHVLVARTGMAVRSISSSAGPRGDSNAGVSVASSSASARAGAWIRGGRYYDPLVLRAVPTKPLVQVCGGAPGAAFGMEEPERPPNEHGVMDAMFRSGHDHFSHEKPHYPVDRDVDGEPFWKDAVAFRRNPRGSAPKEGPPNGGKPGGEGGSIGGSGGDAGRSGGIGDGKGGGSTGDGGGSVGDSGGQQHVVLGEPLGCCLAPRKKSEGRKAQDASNAEAFAEARVDPDVMAPAPAAVAVLPGPPSGPPPEQNRPKSAARPANAVMGPDGSIIGTAQADGTVVALDGKTIVGKWVPIGSSAAHGPGTGASTVRPNGVAADEDSRRRRRRRAGESAGWAPPSTQRTTHHEPWSKSTPPLPPPPPGRAPPQNATAPGMYPAYFYRGLKSSEEVTYYYVEENAAASSDLPDDDASATPLESTMAQVAAAPIAGGPASEYEYYEVEESAVEPSVAAVRDALVGDEVTSEGAEAANQPQPEYEYYEVHEPLVYQETDPTSLAPAPSPAPDPVLSPKPAVGILGPATVPVPSGMPPQEENEYEYYEVVEERGDGGGAPAAAPSEPSSQQPKINPEKDDAVDADAEAPPLGDEYECTLQPALAPPHPRSPILLGACCRLRGRAAVAGSRARCAGRRHGGPSAVLRGLSTLGRCGGRPGVSCSLLAPRRRNARR